MKESTKKLYVLAGLFVALMVCTAGSVSGQIKTNDLYVENQPLSQFKESIMVPLSNVLEKVEQTNHITFLYQPSLIDGKKVSKTVLTTTDLAHKIGKLLAQNGLTYEKQAEGVYVIKRLAGFHDMVQPAAASQVNGTVTDGSTGKTLPGVNIRVKGTTTGTSTDAQGQYELTVESLQDTLVFSFVGYQTQQVPIDGRTEINVEMQSQAISGQELVVVGYGTQEKKSLTSSISTMGGDEIESVSVGDLSNTIGGRLSGVIVKQTSGQPGRDGSDIYIRGVSTMGSTQPLVVVDGVQQRGFQELDPNSIESITVLKDAAAVAPYGMAGANGVVLVTTKQGQKDSPTTISYNGYVGFQRPTIRDNLVNGYQYATLKNVIAENEGLPKAYSDKELQKFKDGSDPDRYPPLRDIWGTLTKKYPLLTHHNIQFSGGSDVTSYYASIGYQNQAGMWATRKTNPYNTSTHNPTNSRRYNISLNLDSDVTPTTDISFKIQGILEKNSYPTTDRPGAGSTVRTFELVKYIRPDGNAPIYYSNGMNGSYAPAAIFGSGSKHFNTSSIFSQLSIEQDIPFISGLQLKGRIAYDPTFDQQKIWSTPLHLAKIDYSQQPYKITDAIFGNKKPQLIENRTQSYQVSYQARVDYKNTFGKNNIDLLGVFEAIRNSSSSLGASRRNYDLYIPEINLGSSSSIDMTTSGSSSNSRRAGIVYRVSYNYNEKYLFQTSGRYDGNYYFAPGHRWGFFPAVSIGWRLSEENFIKKNSDWIDNLKLKASYGEVGALAGAPFQYLKTYSLLGDGYVIGGNGVSAAMERAEVNPNITWERARKSNIGIELSLWDRLVNLDVEYFYEKRANMLVAPDVEVPAEYGIGLSQVNAAKMQNKGIDLSGNINYSISKDWSIALNGNFTYAKNKVLKIFENPTTYDNPNRRRTGRPLGEQFGYQATGYFTGDDFDSEGNLKSGIVHQPWGKVQPGDIRYKDVNGDGEINSQDHVPIGNPTTPRIIYGISPTVDYKNFSLKVLFQGVGDVSHYFERSAGWAFYNGRTAFEHNFDYWTPDNPDAEYPRLHSAPIPNNTQFSSHWMRDVSYLRLKSANLAYTLPPSVTDKIKMRYAQIYLSGQNIITWSGVNDLIDPESASSGGYSYPQQKVFTVGLRLKF